MRKGEKGKGRKTEKKRKRERIGQMMNWREKKEKGAQRGMKMGEGG